MNTENAPLKPLYDPVLALLPVGNPQMEVEMY